MKSTGRYVHRRIEKQSGKDAYRDAMRACIEFVSAGEYELSTVKAQIEGWKDHLRHRFPNKFLSKRDYERRHHDLACQHALDIVNSIEARFITGSCDSEPRLLRGQGVVYYYDDSLFD